jgi:mannose-1-phosphate guanylyltransferase/mannose-6-phosphate isomerase
MSNKHKSNVFGLILAGGSGSRLWPLSREMFPKQLLRLCHDSTYTLFQKTINNFHKLDSLENIVVVTNVKHERDIKSQYQEISDNIMPEIVIEPLSKNTAPALMVSIEHIKKRYHISTEEMILIATPSDNNIQDSKAYIKLLYQAIELAENGLIVALGINPTAPDTSFGYVKANKNPGYCDAYFNVLEFIEKPPRPKAEQFIREGNYFWNSGIYIFKASILLQEIKKLVPDLYDAFQNLKPISENLTYETYKDLPDISIDYAVMEKTDKLVLLPAEIGWSDLGNWNTVYKNAQKDSQGNFTCGNVIAENCENCLIYGSENLVVGLGLENLFIVSTEDATLVCHPDHTQEVKQIYQQLIQKKDKTYHVHKTQIRPWGYFTLLKEEKDYQIRNIVMKAGCQSSLHMHRTIDKHWTVIKGKAKVILDKKEFTLKAGESLDIKSNIKHQLVNSGDDDLNLIEIYTGDNIQEDDIIRFEE